MKLEEMAEAYSKSITTFGPQDPIYAAFVAGFRAALEAAAEICEDTREADAIRKLGE